MQKTIKFFIVKTKCGHVGRNRFIPVDLPIKANSARDAAAIARQQPGVKHHHDDAILSVTEVTREEFIQAAEESGRDLYWRHEHLGTRNNLALFISRIEPETPYHMVHKPIDKRWMFPKANKVASRDFRYRRTRQDEVSLRNEIQQEFGLSI